MPDSIPKLQADQSEQAFVIALANHGVDRIKALRIARREVLLRTVSQAQSVNELKPVLQRLIGLTENL